MSRARRLRGGLIRLVRRRTLAITVGLALATPATLLMASEYRWETGVTDGLSLLGLATGIALVWTGLSGRQPDWID